MELPRGFSDDSKDQEETSVSASWATPETVEQLIAIPHIQDHTGGIWLGRNLETNSPCVVTDDRHIVTVAGSRAGKGRSGIIPTLCLYKGSVICIDPKGENLKLTAARRGTGNAQIDGLHQHVKVLDPFKIAKTPIEYEARFNPLALVTKDNPDAIEITELIADAIVVPTGGKDAHWDENARTWIQAIILMVATDDRFEGRRNLGVVKRVIDGTEKIYPNEPLTEDEGPFDQLYGHMESLSTSKHPIEKMVAAAFNMLADTGPNERGSILSTTRRNLKFLDAPGIQECLSGDNDWELDNLKTDPDGLSVYLVLPQRYMSTHARWMRMIITLLITRLEIIDDEPATGYPVLAILDEANVLGNMKIIETSAGFMAGFGLKLWSLWQDLSQMKRHYERSWETFLGNAGTLIFFGNTDLTTLEHVSKRLGQYEVVRVSETTNESTSTAERDLSTLEKVEKGRRGQAVDLFGVDSGAIGTTITTSNSTNIARTPTPTALMTADEVARHFSRQSGQQIVMLAGEQPMVLQRTNYDQDALFQDKLVPR